MKKICSAWGLSIIAILCLESSELYAVKIDGQELISESMLTDDEQRLIDEIVVLIQEINETIATMQKNPDVVALGCVVDELKKQLDRKKARMDTDEPCMVTRTNKSEREKNQSMIKDMHKMVADIKNRIVEMQKVLNIEDIVALIGSAAGQAVDKASRPDAVVLADPSYPPTPYDSGDLAIIRQCLCQLKDKIDQLLLCACAGVIEGNGRCFPAIVTEADIDNTVQSVIQWLKSIMKDIRGVCSNCC